MNKTRAYQVQLTADLAVNESDLYARFVAPTLRVIAKRAPHVGNLDSLRIEFIGALKRMAKLARDRAEKAADEHFPRDDGFVLDVATVLMTHYRTALDEALGDPDRTVPRGRNPASRRSTRGKHRVLRAHEIIQREREKMVAKVRAGKLPLDALSQATPREEKMLRIMGGTGSGRDKNPAARRASGSYHPRNPKIDLFDAAGNYLASTNFSPTVRDAIRDWNVKHPERKAFRGSRVAKRNPAARRVGTSTTARSMITRRKPSKRLIKRRRRNTRAGYFPNPARKTPRALLKAQNDAVREAIFYRKRMSAPYDDLADALEDRSKLRAEIKRIADLYAEDDPVSVAKANAAFKKLAATLPEDAALALANAISARRKNPLSATRKMRNALVRQDIRAVRAGAARGSLTAVGVNRAMLKGSLAARRANPRHVTARIQSPFKAGKVTVKSRGPARKSRLYRVVMKNAGVVSIATHYDSKGEAVNMSPWRTYTPVISFYRPLAMKIARQLARAGYKKVAVVSNDCTPDDVKAALA